MLSNRSVVVANAVLNEEGTLDMQFNAAPFCMRMSGG